jgi:hypothetical protein
MIMLVPRFYALFEECIENGASRGLQRAYKHDENPTRESMVESITNCIMGELHERFVFPDEAA